MLNMLQINEPIKDIGPLLALTNQLPIEEVSIMAKATVSKTARICQAEGCEKKTHGRGLCDKHYRQKMVYGEVMARTKYTPNEFIVSGDICRITLYNPKHELIAEAIIDADDKDIAAQRKWHLNPTGYVACSKPNSDWLSRCVMAPVPDGYDVDHINHDKLDNRKSNLRFATRSQNLGNKLHSPKSLNGFKGITWKGRDKKWVAQITKDYKHIYIGAFFDKRSAAEAYDKKALELFGEFAATNKRLGLL